MYDSDYYTHADRLEQDWIDGVASGFERALKSQEDLSYLYINDANEGARAFGRGMAFGYQLGLEEREGIFQSYDVED